jgi:hypothetical protein
LFLANNEVFSAIPFPGPEGALFCGESHLPWKPTEYHYAASVERGPKGPFLLAGDKTVFGIRSISITRIREKGPRGRIFKGRTQ